MESCTRSGSTPSALPRTSSSTSCPTSSPAAGQVRIAVEASGVHLLDTTIRRGEPGPLPPPELPTVPGREVAGVVDAVGPDVDDGLARSPRGGAPRAGAGRVRRAGGHRPSTSSSRSPTTSRSRTPSPPSAPGGPRWAWSSSSRPAADDVVLVPSAAGGLGWLLVQAALAAGATVVAAARGERTAALAELGADLVVDYGEPGWDERGARPSSAASPWSTTASAARSAGPSLELLRRAGGW